MEKCQPRSVKVQDLKEGDVVVCPLFVSCLLTNFDEEKKVFCGTKRVTLPIDLPHKEREVYYQTDTQDPQNPGGYLFRRKVVNNESFDVSRGDAKFLVKRLRDYGKRVVSRSPSRWIWLQLVRLDSKGAYDDDSEVIEIKTLLYLPPARIPEGVINKVGEIK